MLKGKVTLVLDLGNSETRMYVIYGDKKASFNLPNRFYEIDSNYIIADEYNEENTNIFEVGGVKRIAAGALVQREFLVESLRPTAIDKKYSSFVSKLSLNYAFFTAYKYLMDAYNLSETELGDVTFNVTALLPPSDIDHGAKQMAELIKGIKEVNFEMPKFKKEVVVDSVKILPEGFCAYIGVLMTSGLKIRESHKHLIETSTLVIDIGAGTTDFCIIRDNKVLEETRDSFELGGNNISQKVRKRLKQEGFNYPDHIIQESIQTGYVKDGAKQKDIGPMVEEIKESVASSMVNEIKAFFESTQYPIRTIENLLVCGGGTIDPEREDMKALSTYLVKYMERLSPNIELVSLPKVKNEDGEKVSVSPRRLNIMGATVLSE